MDDVNMVVIEGNLVADPEAKQISGGTEVANFAIGVNRSFKNKSTGEWQKESAFFDVEAWGGLAKLMQKTEKGMRIRVTGRLKQNRWEASDGTKRSRVVVSAASVDVQWPKREESGSTIEPSGGEAEYQQDLY